MKLSSGCLIFLSDMGSKSSAGLVGWYIFLKTCGFDIFDDFDDGG